MTGFRIGLKRERLEGLAFFLLSSEIMESLFLDLKVVPNKKQNRIVKSEGDQSFMVELKAKPVEGRANQELIKYLAKVLGIRQNQIMIIKGIHSHHKVLRIEETKKRMLLDKLDEIQSP